ncbi:MAG: electron transfer flavoprotein subunit alpha/FixB family protein [Gammaproteobacteria bacterium]|nr:electron transfer flavoprotein subunit alpha/FixB family protein [Gammaproteobacteria bacterium]QOJ31544.1 MAG: electron transfer flavoprotein subunit alpha/FixB family protein [Gammaproteobacteria bacterium]
MAKVLVVAEHSGGSLNQSTARCISCALQIDAAGADVVVLGSDCAAPAAQAAALQGVARVRTLQRAENAAPLAAVLAPQVAALAAGYSHVLGPSTTFGKDLMPRIAGLLGVDQVSDLMSVEGPRRFKRPVYAGNALITVEVADGVPVVATVRAASFKPAGPGGPAPVETAEAATTLPGHTRFVELRAGGGGDRPDLQTARVVISGGRGVGSEANFALLYDLAAKVGAAVGASRAAVDAGYVPNDMQVGQTGKIIAPELYMAFGISGAIQHLTGIKDAGLIVAVNKDPEAAIFQVADIGLVGDLFEVIPALAKRLA